MKKKLVVFMTALVLALSFSLVACGEEKAGVEKGVLTAAPAVTSIVSSTDSATGTAAYTEVPEKFQKLSYYRDGEAKAIENKKPLVLTSESSSTVFKFATRLNLDKLDKDTNFIEFVVIPSGYDASTGVGNVDFGAIEVTLTQVSDPTRTLTFRTQSRDDIDYETCGVLGGNGQSLQGKYVAAHNGSWFQSGYGTQIQHTFNGKNPVACGYSVDADEKVGYVYQARGKSEPWIIRDLDADSDLNGDNPWDGFTDNEVTLSVKLCDFTGDTAGSVAILSVNGALLGAEISDTEAPQIDVVGNYSEETMGEKGKGFPVPSFSAYDAYDGIIDDVTVKVYKDYGSDAQKEFTVTNGKFTPDAAGAYAVVATVTDAAGNMSKKVIYVNVAEKLVPLTIKLSAAVTTEVKMGENVACPTATVSGGTTGKGYDLIVTDNDGNEVAVDYQGRFLAAKQGTYRIRYSVYDYLDNRVNYDYYCRSLVNETPIVEWPTLPSTVAKNYVVGVPEFKAEDWYSYLSPVDAIVTYWLKKPGEAEFTKLSGATFSSDVAGENIFKIEARAHKSDTVDSNEYTINVVDAKYVRDYFVTDNMTIQNVGNYIRFVPDAVNEEGSLSFINPMLASGFDIKFANYANETATGAGDGWEAVNYAKLILTDKDNPELTLTITMKATERFNGVVEFAGGSYKADGSSFDSTKPFNIALKDGYITNNGAKLVKIATYDNGLAYDGFTSDYLYATLVINAKRADAQIQLRSLSSHANFTYNGKDNSSPVVRVMGTISTATEVGQIVNIPEIQLFDVFSGHCVATSTVKKDGKTIVSHTGAIQFTATEHGIYNLEVFGRDASGNMISYTASIYCDNLTKPVITLKGAVPEWGTVGKKITLVNATAVDSLGGELTVHVNVMRPGGSALSPTEYVESDDGKTVSFTPDRPGTYVVYYHAFDENFNAQWLKFFIEVTEK